MNANANTITTMGLLSQLAYLKFGEEPIDKGNLINQFVDDGIVYNLGTTYKVLDHTPPSDQGFNALLLEETKKINGKDIGIGKYVIAFRGTEKNSADILTDLAIAGHYNPQYNDAVAFVNSALGKTCRIFGSVATLKPS